MLLKIPEQICSCQQCLSFEILAVSSVTSFCSDDASYIFFNIADVYQQNIVKIIVAVKIAAVYSQ